MNWPLHCNQFLWLLPLLLPVGGFRPILDGCDSVPAIDLRLGMELLGLLVGAKEQQKRKRYFFPVFTVYATKQSLQLHEQNVKIHNK